MGLLDFLSRDAGQQRRAWLDKKSIGVLDALQYYAGPGVDTRQIGGLLGMFNPVQDVGEAMGNARDGDYIGAAVNSASALAPVAAWKLAGSPVDEVTNALTDTLAGVSMKAQGAADAGRQFAGDEFGGVPLRGGGMSDPTQTGWTFKDVDASLNRVASKADNRRINADTSRVETVPIRELYAMQPNVNADFSTASSSAGELPLVVRKNGKMFVRDGHHRITAASEDGAQQVKTRFIDLDGRDTSTPLLDYAPNTFTENDDALLAELFGAQPQPGIRAYHGSPHDFDKFSMDAIGTGEGAQAYGHGLYFAESEGVARSYRDELTGVFRGPDGMAKRRAMKGQDHVVAAAKSLRDEGMTWDEAFPILRDSYGFDDSSPVPFFAWEKANSGSMYEVNIKANPDDFLDWDAPLSEQSAKVRDAVNRTARDVEPYGLDRVSDDARGRDLAKMLQDAKGVEALRNQGTAGIKYKDAGSRGMDGAEGTRNYVVFDENLIEIVRKYGIAGAAAMLGVSASDVQAAIGQQEQPQGLLGYMGQQQWQ